MTLQEALRLLVGKGGQIYSLVGKVKSVDDNERTCDVEPLNGDADILGVRLQADLSADKGIYIKPVVNSFVIVTFLDESAGFVSAYSEIESAEIVIQNNKVAIDATEIKAEAQGNKVLINSTKIQAEVPDKIIEIAADGISIAGSAFNLKSALDELIDNLVGLNVIVPGIGAAPLSPATIALLNVTKGKIATFLK
jgi:hypothetical protein